LRSAVESGVMEEGGELRRLKASRKEAEALAAKVPKDQFFQALDFNASRATAMSEELSQYRIVHFTAHGSINSRHPELSGLIFSLVNEKGEPQDGFLRMPEIYHLKLPADLVTLSACQTALGRDVRGEGLIGMTRGFMHAGAARVLASLWAVNDEETASLMTAFYTHLLGKDGQMRMTPAAALRQAQIEMWRRERRSEPFYWAGFVLQGEYK
jgi:CHAT domain-containing protein